MGPLQGRHKTPEEDFISTMPDNVVTNILDRLPLQDVVGTGILARSWRFKWTMLISHLIFDDNFFGYLIRKPNVEKYHVRLIIGRILLQLRGAAITRCVLSLDDDKLYVEDEDIIHWISFLSRTGIEDLTIEDCNTTPYKLPTHLFSCLKLKHLKLRNCYFNLTPTFHCFPNLLSLEASGEHGELGEAISRCPLLEILKLNGSYFHKVPLVEIAKLENLKMLSLSLLNLHPMMILHTSGTIIELLGSLPKLQQLELDFQHAAVVGGFANTRLTIAFPCFKALKLSNICLENGSKLSCAVELIRSCPNVQTLEITADYRDDASPPWVDYNTKVMLQLRSVMFEYLKGSENEVWLIKYLFASSPFLKKIVIRPKYPNDITSDEKLAFSVKLLKLHRASTVVEIDFI